MKGLNSVYEIQETRKSIFLRFISTIYTLIFAVMLIITIILFIFGNRLYVWIVIRFPVMQNLALLIISLRTIVGLIVLLIFFLIIYIAIPNKQRYQRSFREHWFVRQDGWAFPTPFPIILTIIPTMPPCTEA